MKAEQQMVARQSPDVPIMPSGSWDKRVRAMRRDGTVAYARDIATAPIIIGQWSVVEGPKAPPGAKEFIDRLVQPLRDKFLRATARGCFDYGWQPFELDLEMTESAWSVRGLRPLLQGLTYVYVDEAGRFAGYEQRAEDGGEVFIDVPSTLHIVREPVGDDPHGTPVLEAVEPAYVDWCEANKSARRYERKIAGSHVIVTYPPGTTPVYNGRTNVDNFEIAGDILDLFESNGRLRKPSEDGWSVEIISASGGGGLEDRMRYLDTLKVRACRLPERAVLEGQFGTKADASAHADFAIACMMLQHAEYVTQLNSQLVDRVLRWNYGAAAMGTVQVEAAPLSDDRIAFLRTLFQNYILSPDGSLEMSDAVDWPAMGDATGVPFRQEVARLE